MPVQKSGEDYLEAILVLQKAQGAVRSVDVARHMAYSKPSVSRAVGNLRQNGFVEMRDNGELVLTGQGRKVAEEIYERHTILTRLFVQLGIPEEIASEDACQVEHVIQEVTFQKIKEAYQKGIPAEPGPADAQKPEEASPGSARKGKKAEKKGKTAKKEKAAKPDKPPKRDKAAKQPDVFLDEEKPAKGKPGKKKKKK